MARFIPLALLFFSASAAALDPQAALIGDAELQVPLAQFEAELGKAPPQAQYRLLQDRDRIQKLLADLYLRRVLAREAEAAGLDRDPALLAELENYRQRLLASARLEQIRAVQVPDMTAAARDYYRAHPEEFRTDAEVDLAHILIQFTPERGREEARKLAEQLAARIRAGEDIGQLAQQFSGDKSAEQNQGRLGWIRPSKFGPSFAEGVLRLKPGEIGVVESRYGIHVVKLWKVRPARPKPFAQVKDEIVARMAADYRKEQVQHHLDQLRQKSLQINQKVLEEFIDAKLKELALRAQDALPKPAEPPRKE